MSCAENVGLAVENRKQLHSGFDAAIAYELSQGQVA
jgi:hypothetical protein